MIRRSLRSIFKFPAIFSLQATEPIRLLVSNRYFASKRQLKEQNEGTIQIKNNNLKFQTLNYDLYFYPFHPKVIKKNNTLYEINKNSTVLALSFVPKSQPSDESGENSRVDWENRKSIAFKFNDLSGLLLVNTHEHKTWKLEVDHGSRDSAKLKILTIQNSKKTQTNESLDLHLLQLNHWQLKEQIKPVWKISTSIKYSEFELLQFLIKESLYDLSGIRFMFDLRRNEELAKIDENSKSLIDKEQLFRDYDKKDNLI